jgi:hypothetical protein
MRASCTRGTALHGTKRTPSVAVESIQNLNACTDSIL